ncbi:MAG: hypothetical protein ACRCWY_07575 [Cellulosilyticaceae bacterium]
MKIGIVSGRMEQVQVQLLILNYLECWQQEEGAPIWQHFFEDEVTEGMLELLDVVFFVRTQSLKGLYMMMMCRAKHVRTIYLLDDHWLSPEWPQELQCFRQCLACSEVVWVYNLYVYEAIRKYHDQVYLLTSTVKLRTCSVGEGSKGEKRIGFAGSMFKRPYCEVVFPALLSILEERTDVSIYFKGVYLPLAFEKYRDRIHEEPYTMDYKAYTEQVSKWACHIMLAPLVENDCTKGKCPNKYLEITAMNAAGIYSDTTLYRMYVKHGETGILTPHTAEGWYAAISHLLREEKQRVAIIKAARNEVEKVYTPESTLETFKRMLRKNLEK